jgi:hypothetical protein
MMSHRHLSSVKTETGWNKCKFARIVQEDRLWNLNQWTIDAMKARADLLAKKGGMHVDASQQASC